MPKTLANFSSGRGLSPPGRWRIAAYDGHGDWPETKKSGVALNRAIGGFLLECYPPARIVTQCIGRRICAKQEGGGSFWRRRWLFLARCGAARRVSPMTPPAE